jgi:methylmalonyl-CoA mutase N-terminal domain/subunit
MALEKKLRNWEKTVLDGWLKENPEKKERFTTDAGLEIERLYTPLDLERIGFDYERDLGLPADYPFTRGITPTMYRSNPFLVSVYSGFGTPQHCNQRYKKILEWGGVGEIAIAADLPSQMGYDSDSPMAKGEVGRVGVAIDTLRDMEILFEDIPLNKLNLQNDVLKEYVARGTYIYPIRPSVRLATDVVGYCARHIPHWYPLNICANHIHAAGAGSAKATAFALANGMCYINDLLNKGYQIDEIAPLLTMFLDERSDFFVAICNFRATRRLWARLMKQRLKARDPKSMALKIYAYSHGGETLLEPMNNIVRIALSALAYVLGGVQFLQNASYDEVLGTPTENAAKIAARTQQILAHELGLANTVDPLGGSYFIETLTAQIEKEIEKEFAAVEERGGAIAAIEDGYYTACISEGASRRQREFEKGQRVSIGVNQYRSESKIPSGAFRVDPNIEAEQVERLRKTKQQRNNKTVRDTLEYVREVAQGEGNLVPPVLEAVSAYATVGEICDVFRQLFGEYQRREYFKSS